MKPDFLIEQGLKKYTRIAGVDEVGRGPWAGPVTACAVILDPGNIPDGLNDSKKLPPVRREVLHDLIRQTSSVGIAHVSVQEIDRINILQASLKAMTLALRQLDPLPDFALIDGNRLPADLPCPARSLVKGDGKSLSIAAASIVAKVMRDRLMAELAEEFPGYSWQSNAGYGTPQHIAGLKRLGVTPHHRRSFKPIHNILCHEN